MNPWLETIAVSIVVVSGIVLGRVFSGFRRPYWLGGYVLSALLITILLIARCNSALYFGQPLWWFIAGRAKFVILALATTIGLTTSLSRLPSKLERFAICTLMAVVVVWFSILPFLFPALIKDHLSNIETELDLDGICFQTTNYTCGPAAAVTALRRLGLPAQEGEIAVLAHTSPVTGTLPKCLYSALQNRYGADGLICQYQRFNSIAQLKNAGITLAVVKNAFLLDHCVAILEVSDQMVTVADPVLGKTSIPNKQFEKIWRFCGIVLKRNSIQKT